MTTSLTTSRSRPRWRRVALLFGVLTAAGIGAVATVPMWADSFVQAYAHDRLEKLAGVPVKLARLDLVDFNTVVVEGVELAIGPGTSLTIDHFDVGLDRGSLWSGQVVVVRLEATGGAVVGDVATLRGYARDLQARLAERSGEGSGRVRLIPPTARASGLRVELSDKVGERAVGAKATLAVDAQVAARRAHVELTDVTLGFGERSVGARRIATDLEMPRGTGGLGFPLAVEVVGAVTAVTPKIAAAEIRGTVTVADAAVSRIAVDLVGGFSDEPRRDAAGEADESAPLWALRGDAARDLSDGSIELTMDAFKLGRIPEVLAQLPVVDSEAATVGGDLKVAFADGKAQISGDLDLAGLNVDHPLLARLPVRGLGFSLALAASIDPGKRLIKLDSATLKRGAVELDLDGEFVHTEARETRRYRATLRMPKVKCQEFLAAIPAELIPSMQGFELKGDFEFEIATDIDFANLDALALAAKLDPSTCKPTKVPPLVAATRLNGPLVHRAVMRDGTEVTVDVRDGADDFTALDQISPYMVAAVMTTEDGGFWKHKGFITSQFRAALRRNLEAGKVRLGASTITMQMVKNVLLSHERTLSRKLQEVFLTWYVEQTLTKQRIMELYLNVIEFGPGIYGVTRAASHYFNKLPADLSPPEAAYLALMLPSPVRRHASYCDGAPNQVMQGKLKRLLAIMQNRGRLDPETYEEWKDAGVTFDMSDLSSKKECVAEIERLLAASGQQRSLSGLLEDGGDDGDLGVDVDPTPAAPARGRKGKAKAAMDDAALAVIGGLDEDP